MKITNAERRLRPTFVTLLTALFPLASQATLFVSDYKPLLDLDRYAIPPFAVPADIECPIISDHEAKIEDCIAMLSDLPNSLLATKEQWEDLDEDCSMVRYGYCVDRMDPNTLPIQVRPFQDFSLNKRALAADGSEVVDNGEADFYGGLFDAVSEELQEEAMEQQKEEAASAAPEASATVVPHHVPYDRTLHPGETASPFVRVDPPAQQIQLPLRGANGKVFPPDRTLWLTPADKYKDVNGVLIPFDRIPEDKIIWLTPENRVVYPPGKGPVAAARTEEAAAAPQTDAEESTATSDYDLLGQSLITPAPTAEPVAVDAEDGAEVEEDTENSTPTDTTTDSDDSPATVQRRGFIGDAYNYIKNKFYGTSDAAENQEPYATAVLRQNRESFTPTITESGVVATTTLYDAGWVPTETKVFTSMFPPQPTAYTIDRRGRVVAVPNETPKPILVISEEIYTATVRGNLRGPPQHTRERTRYHTITQPTVEPVRVTQLYEPVYHYSVIPGYIWDSTQTSTEYRPIPTQTGPISYRTATRTTTIRGGWFGLGEAATATLTEVHEDRELPEGAYVTQQTVYKTGFGWKGRYTETHVAEETVLPRPDVPLLNGKPYGTFAYFDHGFVMNILIPVPKGFDYDPEYDYTPPPRNNVFTPATLPKYLPGSYRRLPPNPDPNVLIVATHGTCALAINREHLLPQDGGDMQQLGLAAGQVMKVCASRRRMMERENGKIVAKVAVGESIVGQGGRRVCVGELRNLMLGGC